MTKARREYAECQYLEDKIREWFREASLITYFAICVKTIMVVSVSLTYASGSSLRLRANENA